MKRIFFITTLLAGMFLFADAANEIHPEFSTAGFFQLQESGREAASMNPAWRFFKGDLQNAMERYFDDSGWKVVSLPHGIEYLPTEASGGINYQGVVWYRKHFTPLECWKGKKTVLHFEAIMGKSRIYVNGKLVKEHFGGYLPIAVDVSGCLEYGRDNVIAVWADNSDDPSYPPGKEQCNLDYTYFGGIYRDCWMIVHSPVFITDPNMENCTAGGGLFVAYQNVSESFADVLLKLQVKNSTSGLFRGTVEYEILKSDGSVATTLKQRISLPSGKTADKEGRVTIVSPDLWTPSTPTLYNLVVRIKDPVGNTVDGFRQRIGIRSLEFRGEEGFFLNGKHYDRPLIGANRHQDFAVLGNAVPNSLHWRDAKKLKDTGMEVIRNAHCPQDPAFMDACDELGLFIIDNTPGWQFWNDRQIFRERVYDDIRNLVRRDRNHACLWLWEPILNETDYPADFASDANRIVHEEYPFEGCYCGCDGHANGSEMFPVIFAHPVRTLDGGKPANPGKTYFTREWGDNVDDWGSHNSSSRAARNWGEQPMLVQARHYADLDIVTNFEALFSQNSQHIGGCLWHSFDHQRGYHPDPFYGGIMDCFRQPKYSYYMFMSQRPAEKKDNVPFETGPMVYIAHAMTPFSSEDVTVYSNCDEVHLQFCEDGEVLVHKREKGTIGMPSPIICFKDVYDFMTDKKYSRQGAGKKVFLKAEGFIDGKLVATHMVRPCRRPVEVRLRVDDERTGLHADGSDCVVVIAEIIDKYGNVKRLNNDYIRFEVEGEGRLLGDAAIMANPAPVKWGSAPILLQSTTKAGTIRVRAHVLYQGLDKELGGEIELRSREAAHTLVFDSAEAALIPAKNPESDFSKPTEYKRNDAGLIEVGIQQNIFGE